MKKFFKRVTFLTVVILILNLCTSCIVLFKQVSVWNGEELKFTLTDNDVLVAKDTLQKAKTASLKGNILKINSTWQNFFDCYYDIATQSNMAYVMYFTDTTNEIYKANYSFATTAYREIYTEYLDALKQIYNSDNRDMFFDGWTDQDVSRILSYDESVASLENANDELFMDFTELSSSEFYVKSVEIYSQTINNGNEIAKKFGYNNYYEYASEMMYNRDYGSSEIEIFRDNVSRKIIPILSAVNYQVDQSFLNLREDEKQIVTKILNDDFDDSAINYYYEYANSYDGSTKNGLLHAFENGNYIMTDYVEAEDAAFTIYLPSYDRPFCYFGPGYQSVFTVAHEMGHYYSGLYIGLENTPLDLDEIYSQANEMLLLDYLKDELSPNVYQALEIYQLSNILNTIVVGTIVDEIEETVYSLNYKPLTFQTLDVIISEVCDNYGGIEFLNTNIFSRGVNEYFREVSVRQPIYYLSYATSAVSSLALYKNAKDDRDSARDKYKVLVENVDVTLGLKKCLSRAEFSSPFSEETFTSIVELF